MADVAFVFHWQPHCMDSMPLGELLHWRELAVQRHNAVNAPQQENR